MQANPKYFFNLLGDISCLIQGGFNFFSASPWSFYHSHFHPTFYFRLFNFFKRFLKAAT